MSFMNHETIYTCPMHPEIKQDKPGMCPECGMTLVKIQNAKVKSQNIGKHAGHSTAMFLRKFWVSLVLTVPIVFFSFQETAYGNWLLLALGSVVFFYGGWVFLAGASRELRGRLPGMMTLIALAITAAFLFSVFEVF